ncbi:DNA alkylation repair protein [Aeromicrobium choanae]|uniref:3-methyladenine DNA glycosylase AlkD n=1 Tax=Aeromicrobium choanae TaxID=1736691 RepID=A0A1T4YS02_9ACTN|nr:DNA alkylation repair protein [Aeromicrobium choanae]SKB04055.1 3-methyladenine DNA glycosylase AlkD [Aeromicrobium choanae]
MTSTAADLLRELRDAADPAAHPQRHYHGGAGVLGVRMGTVFELAKRHSGMTLGDVGRLLDEREYEPRLAAFCVVDFQVRRKGITDAEREERYDLYLARHDRIDSWDMVDRAAPRVVGQFLRDRSREPLFALAASPDPLRRRTAMTAPLAYTRPAHPEGIADLLRLAELLAADPDPLVSKPVGIALKHAGAVAPDEVRAFLDRLGDRLPAPVRREARAKLP